MVKLRTGDPWVPAPVYGAGLRGLTVNLVVVDIERSLIFHTGVLEAAVVYSDPDIAVLRFADAEWMLHARHTYDDHPLLELTGPGKVSDNAGSNPMPELRLHHCDPDRAEARARELGYRVLAGARDRPHGLRECYLLDGDGYLWVPDVPVHPRVSPS